MRVRLHNRVFIRHAGNESVVWCPNTGGCTVMENAGAILDEVKEWKPAKKGVTSMCWALALPKEHHCPTPTRSREGI